MNQKCLKANQTLKRLGF